MGEGAGLERVVRVWVYLEGKNNLLVEGLDRGVRESEKSRITASFVGLIGVNHCWFREWEIWDRGGKPVRCL